MHRYRIHSHTYTRYIYICQIIAMWYAFTYRVIYIYTSIISFQYDMPSSTVTTCLSHSHVCLIYSVSRTSRVDARGQTYTTRGCIYVCPCSLSPQLSHNTPCSGGSSSHGAGHGGGLHGHPFVLSTCTSIGIISVTIDVHTFTQLAHTHHMRDMNTYW